MEGLCVNHNTPRKVVWRAEIVRATADGSGTSEIMRRADTSKPTVWRWQERYLDEGVAGLMRDSAGGPARGNTLEPLHDGRSGGDLAVERRLHLGRGRPQATPRAQVQGLERPDVRGEGHRDRRALSRSPDRAVVLCVDEKSQIQALDRTQPGLPLKKGLAETMTHDYKGANAAP